MNSRIKPDVAGDLPAYPNEDGIHKLAGKSGKPYRLYTRSGRPVTDPFGIPLRNIWGKKLFHFNPDTNHCVDLGGNLLCDAYGNKPGEFDFDPERVPRKEPPYRQLLDHSNKPMLIYDKKGVPLTSISGEPLADLAGNSLLLYDSRGDPICDFERNTIFNEHGETLTDPKKLPILTVAGQPAYLFDAFGKPLTDKCSYPLLDIRGIPLVVRDKDNSPLMTTYGSDLYDADGFRRTDGDFDMSKKPLSKPEKSTKRIKDENGMIVLVFDRFGCPLTDWEGNVLVDREGESLITKMKDITGSEVYSISKENYKASKFCHMRNSEGFPARLYNVEGKPLTNLRGETLVNACGILLLKFGSDGYPSSDLTGGLCFDDCGKAIGQYGFNPFRRIKEARIIKPLTLKNDEAAILFDAKGFPVIDYQGVPLYNPRGKPLIKFNDKNVLVAGLDNGLLFDNSGLPLVESLDKPLHTPKGLSVRLFDSEGNPLTDSYGYILKCIKGEYLVKIDKLGRIVSDRKGGMLYDAKRVPKCLHLEFDCSQVPQHEIKSRSRRFMSPKELYSLKGLPLTDSSGKSLVDVTGKLLIDYETCTSLEGFVFDLEGSTYETQELVGRPLGRLLFTADGIPLTDNRGHILRSRTGEFLVQFDCDGKTAKDALSRPVYDERGKVLTELIPGTNILPPEAEQLRIRFDCQLYDRNDWPLVDAEGFVLNTSKGGPLIVTDKRRPKSDYNGEPVYDENGVPLTTKGGHWVDRHGRALRLYDTEGYPLTDVEGNELSDIGGYSCVLRDGLGRPSMDYMRRPVRDALGITMLDPKFDGSISPQNPQQRLDIADESAKPILLFDQLGRPLTDSKGRGLYASDGSPLVRISDSGSLVNHAGAIVFDLNKVPLGCTIDKPIVSPFGKPLRFYDKKWRPLTDKEGLVLTTAGDVPLIMFDNFGRPVSDWEGGRLYDCHGKKMGESNFDAEDSPLGDGFTMMNLPGLPLRVYDESAWPLTDKDGILLVNSLGVELLGFYIGKLFNEFGDVVHCFNRSSSKSRKKGSRWKILQ